MQKWEYYWVRMRDLKEFGQKLDEQGLKGWELVSVTSVRIDQRDDSSQEISYTGFMKRPKQ